MMLSQQTLDTSVDFLSQNINNLKAIYLFGSQASGNATSTSDIDLAIVCEPSLNPETAWKIQSQMATHLKVDVNLIDLSSATTVFQYEIITTGKKLMSNDEAFTEGFENKIYQLYITLNEDRKEIIEDILKSGKVYD